MRPDSTKASNRRAGSPPSINHSGETKPATMAPSPRAATIA